MFTADELPVSEMSPDGQRATQILLLHVFWVQKKLPQNRPKCSQVGPIQNGTVLDRGIHLHDCFLFSLGFGAG